MKITGYRTLTEKERDYLTIHRLLRKHGVPTPKFGMITIDLLNGLRGDLPPTATDPDALVEFCVTCGDSPDYHLRLAELPENTTELLIETE